MKLTPITFLMLILMFKFKIITNWIPYPWL
jgi:hypothetical protein